MTLPKFSISLLIVCIQISHAQLALAESPPSQMGTIALQGPNQPDKCFLPVPAAGQTATYRVDGTPDTPCSNLFTHFRQIQFNNLPSATEILLTHDHSCRIDDQYKGLFWFRLKTTRKNTSTDFMEISYLSTYKNPPVIVVPGLELKELWMRDPVYPATETIKCVWIKASAAPPDQATATTSAQAY